MSDHIIDLTSDLSAGALNHETAIQAAELIFEGRSRRGEGGDEPHPFGMVGIGRIFSKPTATAFSPTTTKSRSCTAPKNWATPS
jgi:hypothetical protein